MPRVFHVSDTHLGLQSYARLTPDGLNQREVDLQEAFRRVVDAAIRDPPDLFLHTGDLFDHPRPNNRAIAAALDEVRRLGEARIPTVLVNGNHDAPRMRETGSIFRIFEGLPFIHPVHRGRAERIEAGGVVVHAVPQAPTQELFLESLRSTRPSGPGPHVLAIHGSVLGVDGLFTSEFNEYQIPLPELRPEFDYVALGHFHTFRQVAPNAYYAGSPEYCSFQEADQEKVWLEAVVEPGRLQVTPRSAGARAMKDLGVLDATGADPQRVTEEVIARLKEGPAGGIARLTVERIDRSVARVVDWDALRTHRSDLVHLELRVRPLQEDHAQEAPLDFGGLGAEFESFLARYPLPEADRERVRAAALELLTSSGRDVSAA